MNVVNWEHLGDGNLDGKTDAADAVLVLNFFMTSVMDGQSEYVFTLTQHLRADINDNGSVTAEDAQNILEYYAMTLVADSEETPASMWAEILNR